MMEEPNFSTAAPLLWTEVSPTMWAAKQGAVSISLIECDDLFVVSDHNGDLLGMFSSWEKAR